MSGRRSSRRLKVILAGLVLAGSMSFLTISGTYAIFTSQEGNAGATAASGTLTMGNSVNAGTTCVSYTGAGSGNVNSSCTALFTTATLQYPGSTASANVAINDNGSLSGKTLSAYMPSCVQLTSPSATVVNGGNPCTVLADSPTASGIEMTIEEYPTSAFTTPSACWYPVVATGACSSASGYAAALPDSFPIFATYLNSSSAPYSLGTGPVAGATRYFKVTLMLPTNASNLLQGEEAQFALTWHLST